MDIFGIVFANMQIVFFTIKKSPFSPQHILLTNEKKE